MVKIQFGDVICVERNGGLYKHFGVYSGNKKVIHYVKEGNDEFNGVIRETSFDRFLANDANCYVCLFDDNGNRNSTKAAYLPQGLGVQSAIANPLIFMMLAKSLYDLIFSNKGKLYSAQETVDRARSCIGKKGYNLVLHNCEHFAVWCKTGIEKSEQVEEMIKLVAMTIARL